MLACTGCHGREGRAAPDGYYPRIAGKPAGYLFNQLRNFRDERRHYELMNGLLALLDDDYLREIADHFASLDLPYPAPLAPIGSAALRERRRSAWCGAAMRRAALPACIACHGAPMTGRAPFIPGLLGLPRDYLNAQLGAWRSGKRRALPPDCMAADRAAALARGHRRGVGLARGAAGAGARSGDDRRRPLRCRSPAAASPRRRARRARPTR